MILSYDTVHWSIDEKVVKSYWVNERKAEMESFNWWIFFTYDWFKRFYMIHICEEKRDKTGQRNKQRYLLYVVMNCKPRNSYKK